MLKEKNIILGVSGGIASYKSIELLRLLQKEGANVFVIMTKNATEFVSPLTFEALSKNPVYTEMFEKGSSKKIRHIKLAQIADLVIVAPATANTIAKFACGIADDPLSTFMLAVKSKKLICPSMNSDMYENPITQNNIKKLKENDFFILEPEEGELACIKIGKGRLPKLDIIIDEAKSLLTKKDLKGKKILITAGPTIEAIDPVRYITNHSSGKMGYAIANAATKRGADVILISGKTTDIEKPYGTKLINVLSANDMAKRVLENFKKADIIIKVAAVADYKPLKIEKNKIKKKDNTLTLLLTKNIDILKTIGKKKRKNQILVGFAAETENIKKNAEKKLKEKNLDMIVANKVGADLSFGTDESKVSFIFKNGKIETLPLTKKKKIADEILDRILNL